ncbi:MAG: hypothetical protein KAT17_06090 [Candidatus Aminicenantes bacterium]|nr:hypothetical protein [Candidatus Aminicenantes bacterium]
MKIVSIFIISFFLFNSVAYSVFGESVDLVTLKKKEEERRKKIKKSKYKVTNNNLNTLKIPEKKYGFVQLTGYFDFPDEKEGEPGKTPPKKEDPKKKRKYWQELKIRLENEIGVLRKKVNEDQLRLNQMVTNHISMNLPLQKIDLKNRIDKLSASLDQTKSKLKNLQSELDSLPEKARKAGIPSGWVR